MIHDRLVRLAGPRLGGALAALSYAAMLLAILHFWDRGSAGLAYLH